MTRTPAVLKIFYQNYCPSFFLLDIIDHPSLYNSLVPATAYSILYDLGPPSPLRCLIRFKYIHFLELHISHIPHIPHIPRKAHIPKNELQMTKIVIRLCTLFYPL